jgi:lysophospholipase L1-like esterase
LALVTLPAVTLAGTARRIAAAAAYGGTGLGLLGASAWGVLLLEARLARRAIGLPTTAPPPADGVYLPGRVVTGAELGFVVLGDSSAAGLGAEDADETVGALTAAGLAELTDRPVRLTVTAVVGADSRTLLDQLPAALAAGPEVALVMIGANDVTHRLRPEESVRYLAEAVTRLRDGGAEVVVGTCPDLGTIEPIPHPLRWVARHWSRQLASAQTVEVVAAGGRTVSLASILGPEFAAEPGAMFGPDRFHPSRAGYAAAAAALLPSLAVAAGAHGPDDDPETYGTGYLPVAVAAARAAVLPGTEVTPAQVAGHDRGPGGRWAQVRWRRRRPLPDVTRVPDESAPQHASAGPVTGAGNPAR